MNDGAMFHESNRDSDLAPQWDELILDSMHPNVFLTWDWVSIWVKWFASQKKLRIIQVWDGSQLIGILPLYLCPVELFPGISVEGLKFIGDGDVVFPDFLGPIIRKGCLDSVLSCLQDVFASDNKDYRFLRLADMDLASEGTRCLVDGLSRGIRSETIPGDVCPYIEFSGNYESFLASLNSKRRSSIKSNDKKAFSNFHVRLECYQTLDKVDEAFELIIQIFSKATRGQDKVKGFLRKDYAGFHKEVARAFARKGWLRIYILHYNDIPVAYLYGYVFNKAFWFYQTSYDLAYKEYTPGAVALQQVIKSLIDEGAEKFDFLRGDEAYKLKICTGHKQLTTAYIFRDKSSLYSFYKWGRNMKHFLSSTKKILMEKTERLLSRPVDGAGSPEA